MDQARPEAEVTVDESLAEALLLAQCPEFATGPIERVGEGWDNVTFRVGPDLALRLPRREVAVELLRREQRWLPRFAGRLDVAIPVPVAIGAPSELFPWPWSVVPWIPGRPLGHAALPETAGVHLASLLRALHQPAPPEAPHNRLRGVPLAERRSAIERRLERLADPRLDALWARALLAEPDFTKRWFHGDLHPGNVIVRDDRVVGIIDWGDLGGGDVATDLACAWTLFDGVGRDAFLDAYGPAPAEFERALGWAVHFGSALATSGDVEHEAIGRVIVERLHRTDA